MTTPPDTSININNNFQYPNLPVSIIWPEDEEDVPWFMMRLYEQMVSAINSKDNGVFTMAISSTPTLIPNMNNFGTYLVNLCGEKAYTGADGTLNYWPSYIFQITKSAPNEKGLDSVVQNQDGKGNDLGGVALLLTQQQVPSGTGPYYYFINHDKAGFTGSFSVNIQGTQ